MASRSDIPVRGSIVAAAWRSSCGAGPAECATDGSQNAAGGVRQGLHGLLGIDRYRIVALSHGCAGQKRLSICPAQFRRP